MWKSAENYLALITGGSRHSSNLIVLFFFLNEHSDVIFHCDKCTAKNRRYFCDNIAGDFININVYLFLAHFSIWSINKLCGRKGSSNIRRTTKATSLKSTIGKGQNVKQLRHCNETVFVLSLFAVAPIGPFFRTDLVICGDNYDACWNLCKTHNDRCVPVVWMWSKSLKLISNWLMWLLCVCRDSRATFETISFFGCFVFHAFCL